MADLTFLYKELTPIQVGQFTEFSASLNNVLSADKMQEAQQLNVVNYCADLLGALRSGLPWTHLQKVSETWCVVIVTNHIGKSLQRNMTINILLK